MRRFLVLSGLSEALKSDPSERWITVHPHGKDEPGVPIKLKVDPANPNIGRVVGGAGGKLNYKVVHIKSKDEYRAQARARRQKRRQEGKSQLAGRSKAKEAVREGKVAAERKEIQAVASALGWSIESLTVPEEQLVGMSDKEKAKAHSDHHRQLLKDVKKARAAAEAYVAANPDELEKVKSSGKVNLSEIDELTNEKTLRSRAGYKGETSDLDSDAIKSEKARAIGLDLADAVNDGDPHDIMRLSRRLARFRAIDGDDISTASKYVLAGFCKVASARLKKRQALLSELAGTEESAKYEIPEEVRDSLDLMAKELGGSAEDSVRMINEPGGAAKAKKWARIAADNGLLDPAEARKVNRAVKTAKFDAVGAKTPDEVTADDVAEMTAEQIDVLAAGVAEVARKSATAPSDIRKEALSISPTIPRNRRQVEDSAVAVPTMDTEQRRAFIISAIDAGVVGQEADDATPSDEEVDTDDRSLAVDSMSKAVHVWAATKNLKQIKKTAARHNRALDKGEEVPEIGFRPAVKREEIKAEAGGTLFNVVSSLERPTEEFVKQAENDIRTARATAFISQARDYYDKLKQADTTLPLPTFEDTINRELSVDAEGRRDANVNANDGAAAALNEHAVTILGQPVVDRQVIDSLGVDAAARLVAHAIHQAHGDESKAYGDALGDYHAGEQVDIAETASHEARDHWHRSQEIHSILERGDVADSGQLFALNKERIKELRSARAKMGRALGQMEATATLHYHTGGPVGEFTASLGSIDVESAVKRVSALGLSKEDYDIVSDDSGTFVTLKPSAFDKLVRKTDPELEKKRKKLREIRNSEADPDWLPSGFARRSDHQYEIAEQREPHAKGFDYGLQEHDNYHDAMETHVAQMSLDGHSAADINDHLMDSQRHMDGFGRAAEAGHIGSVGDAVQKFQDAHREVFPTFQRDKLTGRHYRVAAESQDGMTRSLAEKYLEDKGLDGSNSLHYQELQGPGDDGIDHRRDAAFRALARHPEAVAAYKEPEELTNADREALRMALHRQYGLRDDETAEFHRQDADNREKIKSWREQNPEPPKEVTLAEASEASGGQPDMFADLSSMVANPRHKEWSDSRDAFMGGLPSTAKPPVTWDSYVEAHLGSLQHDTKKLADARDEALGEWEQSNPRPHLAEGDTPGEEHEEWNSRRKAEVERHAEIHGEVKAPERKQAVQQAYRSIQDVVKGKFLAEFADHYEGLTGHALVRGQALVDGWSGHEVAVRPEWASHYQDTKADAVTETRERNRRKKGEIGAGHFGHGSAHEEIQKRAISERSARRATYELAGGDGGDGPGSAPAPKPHQRLSLGQGVDHSLHEIVQDVGRSVDPKKPFQALTGIHMSGKYGEQQRAIKSFVAAKRIGMWVGRGSGKTNIAFGAFGELRKSGVKRGLFAVPSIVQEQFGTEALSYLEPGKLNWFSEGGASKAKRFASYRNPNHHMVVMTHQSLRDDVTDMVASHLGMDRHEVVSKMTGFDKQGEPVEPWSRSEVDKHVRAALEKNGADGLLDFLAVDEGHVGLNRAGKRDSHMARVLDSLGRLSAHFGSFTGSPVKNDASELYDHLAKVSPKHYGDEDGQVDRAEFMRRYSGDITQHTNAIRHEISPHTFVGKISAGTTPDERKIFVEPSDEQHARLGQIDDAYDRCREARAKGEVDVSAVKDLAPARFRGVPEDEHHSVAKAFLADRGTLGLAREAARNHAIDQHEKSAKLDKIVEDADARLKSGKPGVIFAHNLSSVDRIRSALEEKGHKVAVITAGSAQAQAKAREKFQRGDADCIVVSDAGKVGANLQRGQWLFHHDTPSTYMTWDQRNGRIDRLGQKTKDIELRTYVVNHPHEHKKLDNLERKRALNDTVMDSDLEKLDESGLAHYIKRHIEQKRAKGPKA